MVTTLTKEITIMCPDITFSLSSEELSDVTKGISQLSVHSICVLKSGLKVTDKKNDMQRLLSGNRAERIRRC